MCLEIDHCRNICSRGSSTDQLVHNAVGKDPWITSAQSGLCTNKIKEIYVSPALENSLCFRTVLFCDSPDIKEERFAIMIKLKKKPRHELTQQAFFPFVSLSLPNSLLNHFCPLYLNSLPGQVVSLTY